MTSSPGPGAISIERNVGSRLVWLEGLSNDSESLPFPSCLLSVPAVGVRGKPHGGAGRGRGRDRDRAQPVTGTAVREAPELPEVGDAHVFKHDAESNLRGATMETACAVSLASALLVSVETKRAPLIGLREFAMLLSCHHTSNAWVRAAVGLFYLPHGFPLVV